MSNGHRIGQPLAQRKLTLMRCRTVSTNGFRRLMNEIGMPPTTEATRDPPLHPVEAETPPARTKAPTLSGKPLVFTPASGVRFLDGMFDPASSAWVAHIGRFATRRPLTRVEHDFKAAPASPAGWPS